MVSQVPPPWSCPVTSEYAHQPCTVTMFLESKKIPIPDGFSQTSTTMSTSCLLLQLNRRSSRAANWPVSIPSHASPAAPKLTSQTRSPPLCLASVTFRGSSACRVHHAPVDLHAGRNCGPTSTVLCSTTCMLSSHIEAWLSWRPRTTPPGPPQEAIPAPCPSPQHRQLQVPPQFFFVARRVETVMHVMQMIDNRRWNETHVTVELEKEASSRHLVRTHALLTFEVTQKCT